MINISNFTITDIESVSFFNATTGELELHVDKPVVAFHDHEETKFAYKNSEYGTNELISTAIDKCAELIRTPQRENLVFVMSQSIYKNIWFNGISFFSGITEGRWGTYCGVDIAVINQPITRSMFAVAIRYNERFNGMPSGDLKVGDLLIDMEDGELYQLTTLNPSYCTDMKISARFDCTPDEVYDIVFRGKASDSIGYDSDKEFVFSFPTNTEKKEMAKPNQDHKTDDSALDNFINTFKIKP